MAWSLERFWELLEANFPLGGPRPRIRELLGADIAEVLERLRVLRHRGVADWYPCPGFRGDGCPRIVVQLDDGTYRAVCANEPAECSELVLTPKDVAYLAIDPEALCSGVARALQVRSRFEAAHGLVHVFRMGVFIPEPGVRHPVFFVARCSHRAYAEVLDALRSRHEDGAFAVTVPTDRFVADETLRQMETLGVKVLVLSDAIGLDKSGFVARVDSLRFFEGIGRRGPGRVPASGAVVAEALVARGDGREPERLRLDERGYKELLGAADQYEIFADERTRTVVKGTPPTRKRMTKVQPRYFRMVRCAAEKHGYFDPNIEGPDEEIVSGKQVFQRARKTFDLKYRDASNGWTWRLFKSAKVENHTVYHFSPDRDVSFALIFLPES